MSEMLESVDGETSRRRCRSFSYIWYRNPSSAKCSRSAVAFQCFDWNSDISPILGKTVQQVSWVKEMMTSIRFLLKGICFARECFSFLWKNWFLSWSTCCYLPPIDCWITLLFLAPTSARDGSLITGIAIVVTCAKSDLISHFLSLFICTSPFVLHAACACSPLPLVMVWCWLVVSATPPTMAGVDHLPLSMTRLMQWTVDHSPMSFDALQ